jgi:hypothetical protein
MTARISTALFCVVALDAQTPAARPPHFDDYRVSEVYAGKIAPPDVGDPRQYSGTDVRCFSLDRAQYAMERPNFAGHFVVGTCSCGTGCHYLFMWDARTGKLYRDLPFGPLNVGPYTAGGNRPPLQYSGESSRPNSTLLIIEACAEGTCDCATRYRWTGRSFRLLARVASRVLPNCPKAAVR